MRPGHVGWPVPGLEDVPGPTAPPDSTDLELQMMNDIQLHLEACKNARTLSRLCDLLEGTASGTPAASSNAVYGGADSETYFWEEPDSCHLFS